MENKCIYFKQRTKMKNKIKTCYFYCKLNKQIITFNNCYNCPNKKYKEIKKYKYKPKAGKMGRYYNNESIMPLSTLYFNKKTPGCEKHHIWQGVAKRPICEKYGLFIWLTLEQHKYLHDHPSKMEEIKKIAQIEWEKKIGTREEFLHYFIKNRL